ncbi:UDP-glycosyltransferase 85A2 [Apostasia shenzhenica]|uniref:Glycosyltransferase n=1 Tax=Apostasia shenzhenica TaxID=1088818 RepID=A0A2I0A0N5_9ASPA|nr:UDP-glycosyltransferase 85A2 [Apostasia shenzhenica]
MEERKRVLIPQQDTTDMSSLAMEKQHAVFIPYPAQGHISPMLKLAKLLHTKGFHITFILTEFNHRRFVQAHASKGVTKIADFRFETIPDGLPPSEDDATQDIVALCESIMTKNYCLDPFRRLLAKLNCEAAASAVSPPVSCIVSDGIMTFTLDVAHELSIPEILVWTASATGYLAYHHYRHLIERGIIPLKDMADVNNGYLDIEVDWIPGIMKGFRLKDFPSFIRTVNADDILLNFQLHEIARASMASAIVFNTFDELELPALQSLQKILPPIYTIGSISLLSRCTIPVDNHLTAISTSLWKEETSCLRWLEGRSANSVVYVSFGSITVMSEENLVEFAWGLADSGYDFLWMIRPDLMKGESTILPSEFLKETKDRGKIASWCPQEEVLMHPAVGVFLTHCGWNSTLESLCGGVPMICWPFFAEQQTNCRYACTEWGVGMEINNNVKREDVKGLIKEMMGGEKGKEMIQKAKKWKERVVNACGPDGISTVNLEKVIKDVLFRK